MGKSLGLKFLIPLLASLAFLTPLASTQSPSVSPPISASHCFPPVDCGGPFSTFCPPNSYSGFFRRGISWWHGIIPGVKWQKYNFTVADFLKLASEVQNPLSAVKPNAQGNIGISIETGDLIGTHFVPESQGIGIWESHFLNGVFASAPSTTPCLSTMLPIQAFAQKPSPTAACGPLGFTQPGVIPGSNGGYRLLSTAYAGIGPDCEKTKVILEFNYACLDGIVTQLLATGVVAPNTPLLQVQFKSCAPVGGTYQGPGDTVPL